MFDSQGIFEHIKELEEALQDVRRYKSSITLEDLVADRDKRNMVLRALQVAIQSAIDIANHIIAEYRFPTPLTYKESFQILKEKGMLSSNLAEDLSELVGFRNILVHLYWRVDLEKVFKVLNERTDALEGFLKVAKKIVKGS